MNGFKRFCMIAFAIVGVLALLALVLPWLGPWTDIAAGLFAYGWYLMVVEIFILILAIGFVVVFVKGVTAKKPSDVEVVAHDGNTIRIARSAIASQATYLVEEDGTCIAQRVYVAPRKHDTAVDITIWVQPYESLDIRAESAVIDARLKEGLETLVGDRLGKINLNFLEPRKTGDITPGTSVKETSDGYVATKVHAVDRAVRHEQDKPEQAVSYGIDEASESEVAPSSEVTIPMHNSASDEKEA
jgi:uncharacterized membrane protein